MTGHPNEEVLNDHVDGLLEQSELRRVLGHLDNCAECRKTVDELRDVLERAATLGGIAPSRDLFPGIRDGVNPPRRHWMPWAAAAAAAVLAVALLGLPGSWREPAPTGSVAHNAASIEAVLAEFRAAEDQYVRATDRLMQVLEQRRDEIPPETLAVLDENVRVIDAAIAEVRLSLDRNDVDLGGGHALTALYDKKFQLLWRASRLWS